MEVTNRSRRQFRQEDHQPPASSFLTHPHKKKGNKDLNFYLLFLVILLSIFLSSSQVVVSFVPVVSSASPITTVSLSPLPSSSSFLVSPPVSFFNNFPLTPSRPSPPPPRPFITRHLQPIIPHPIPFPSSSPLRHSVRGIAGIATAASSNFVDPVVERLRRIPDRPVYNRRVPNLIPLETQRRRKNHAALLAAQARNQARPLGLPTSSRRRIPGRGHHSIHPAYETYSNEKEPLLGHEYEEYDLTTDPVMTAKAVGEQQYDKSKLMSVAAAAAQSSPTAGPMATSGESDDDEDEEGPPTPTRRQPQLSPAIGNVLNSPNVGVASGATGAMGMEMDSARPYNPKRQNSPFYDRYSSFSDDGYGDYDNDPPQTDMTGGAAAPAYPGLDGLDGYGSENPASAPVDDYEQEDFAATSPDTPETNADEEDSFGDEVSNTNEANSSGDDFDDDLSETRSYQRVYSSGKGNIPNNMVTPFFRGGPDGREKQSDDFFTRMERMSEKTMQQLKRTT